MNNLPGRSSDNDSAFSLEAEPQRVGSTNRTGPFLRIRPHSARWHEVKRGAIASGATSFLERMEQIERENPVVFLDSWQCPNGTP